MILLAGGDIVLPDRVVSAGSLLIADARIVAIEPRAVATPAGATRVDIAGCVVVPGFVDVHVHGIEGHDVLDGAGTIAEVARRLPKYGVTSFCPTSIACDPMSLTTMLREVETLRSVHDEGLTAHVLPAHLESNFINPDYKGAQPLGCLRSPGTLSKAKGPRQKAEGPGGNAQGGSQQGADYSGADILEAIAGYRRSVGIITVAPELPGGLDLVRQLTADGHLVSIGHSGATYEETVEAIAAGICHATHLFNRMTPMTHRAPGVPGAVLPSADVRAELICDGFHVHPALMQVAIRSKGEAGILAITDGTAGSGLPVGSRTRLGGRTITVTERTAVLDDGTLAGSVLTMDGAFRTLVDKCGISLVAAARMCATTPADQLRLRDRGRIEVGAVADLAVLDRHLRVSGTYLAGRPWRNTVDAQHV